MPLTIPKCPDKPTPTSTGTTHSYEIELITPMVGGSAKTGEIDIDFPIRPTAIRGHLRHWWRIVRGHALGDGMWQREEEIFGSTEFPSPLTVRVRPLTEFNDRKKIPFSAISPTSNRGYVLFPTIEKKQDLLAAEYKFQISMRVDSSLYLQSHRAAQNRNRKPIKQLRPDIPPIGDDINAAFKAWILFGGVGARTRRGCGSLRVVKESIPMFLETTALQLLQDVLRDTSKEFKVFQAIKQEPHLQAWEKVIGLLKSFRQSPPAQRGAPRKKFPEAETLRRIALWRRRQGRDISVSDLPNGFPRAELGLPIVFQFINGGGPEPMIVLPTGKDGNDKPLQRMSSPIILKPIPISATHSLSTIILVQRPKLVTVDVAPTDNQTDGRRTTNYPITDKALALYPNSPLVGTSGSAIDAFLNFAGFTEVPRS